MAEKLYLCRSTRLTAVTCSPTVYYLNEWRRLGKAIPIVVQV